MKIELTIDNKWLQLPQNYYVNSYTRQTINEYPPLAPPEFITTPHLKVSRAKALPAVHLIFIRFP